MDLGILAVWYDLESDSRSTFLNWMHDEYLPSLQATAGFAWVAHYENTGGGEAMQHVGNKILTRPSQDQVEQGTQFVMLVGAPTPQTFFNPTIAQREATQSAKTREMLALRRGARTAVFTEQTRTNGPAVGTRPEGGTPAPGIQMGSFRVRSVAEEFDLASWYAQYRLPHMAQMPGCVAARKLVCAAGWAKHSVFYEFTSLAARMQNFEEPHEALAVDPEEWTGRVVRYTIHAPGSPTVGQRIWPPVPEAA